jgi:AcrR family transcriptional regulator
MLKKSSLKSEASAPAAGQEAARRPSLAARHADHTRQWIIDAATDLLEENGSDVPTNAAVAQRAGVSERTVYRYFATREALLDEIAAAVSQRLETPEAPQTPEALLGYPAQLFARFEARAQLTRAALAPEVFARLRDGQAAQRRQAVRRMLQAYLPEASAAQLSLAAANIHYLLTATTWHYYRQHFQFDAAQTVLCVQQALAFQLKGLGLSVDTSV